ncbi:metal ABC transporter permease [Thermoflexibacter ruber]|uniref:Manganese/zinc/iron transport system permease protein n=1 Tax=Thermoflexibacter ruber TaxID=1003 RepID=A0A1I2DHL7_9BACT|nr:metal ABC transporter permease [Thermoflexibacter ruber]SFE80004.1 manganese/zinc/iron transport system permease protein [Thermoflexibacter ruber]
MVDFWIILSGSLVAICCSLLGCFLILRKMAMVSDAISHSILPGIVFAFLLTGTRETFTMLIGAGALGLFTTFLIEFFHQRIKLQTDASIGVTFTTLFALGVILISAYAGQIDLDQDCVLYGEIAYTPIDVWIVGENTNLGPRVVWIMGMVLLLVLGFIFFFYKELIITTFDPAFAAACGINVSLWHYLLMGAVSLTTVASFEAVGAILVVGFLIVPPATAYLLTTDLKKMLLLAALIGTLTALIGYYVAVWLDGSIAGAMASVAGLLFLLTFAWVKWKKSHIFERFSLDSTQNLVNSPPQTKSNL